MNITFSVLSIAGAIALGAVSPGPSFVLVARTSVANSRPSGLATALGIGAGGACLTLAALLGLHAVLNTVPWFNLGMKLLGGAYLITLGALIWRDAKHPLLLSGMDTETRASTSFRSFWLGFLTQISNPKAAVIYASIFASLLPREVPTFVNFLLPTLIFLIEAGWYGAVAFALSADSLRARYLRTKLWIDRTTGGVMFLLGARLIMTAWRV